MVFFCPKCMYSLGISNINEDNKEQKPTYILYDSVFSEANLNCNNCGFTKKINESNKLYESNINNKINTITKMQLVRFSI